MPTTWEILHAKIAFLQTVAAQVGREIEKQMADTKSPMKAADAGGPPSPDVPGSYTGDLERSPRPVSRFLTDTERTIKMDEYFWLDARAKWLADERERLKLKFKQLMAALEGELRQVEEDKATIYKAVRYGIIEEPTPPVIEQAAQQQARASAPTSLVASKELPAPK